MANDEVEGKLKGQRIASIQWSQVNPDKIDSIVFASGDVLRLNHRDTSDEWAVERGVDVELQHPVWECCCSLHSLTGSQRTPKHSADCATRGTRWTNTVRGEVKDASS